MDQDAYLNRIRFSGDLSVSVETLNALQKAHLFNVPFENLDIHSGIPIVLDTDKIYHKIVNMNRGGFCYELNGLFYELLISTGFNARRISARVYDKEKGYGPEFDHLAVIVEINGIKYLADVGFGEFALLPLRIETDIIQDDPRGQFTISRYDRHYFQVSKLTEGILVPEYIFSETGRELAEFESMCRYHQTSSDSHFTQKLICSLPTENGRITLSGDILKIKEGEHLKEISVTEKGGFDRVLWDYFNIRVSGKIPL